MGNGLLCGFTIGSSGSGRNFLYKNKKKIKREKNDKEIKKI